MCGSRVWPTFLPQILTSHTGRGWETSCYFEILSEEYSLGDHPAAPWVWTDYLSEQWPCDAVVPLCTSDTLRVSASQTTHRHKSSGLWEPWPIREESWGGRFTTRPRAVLVDFGCVIFTNRIVFVTVSDVDRERRRREEGVNAGFKTLWKQTLSNI